MRANETTPVCIDSVSISGDATIIVGESPPKIPPSAGRECPQCERFTWAKSRLCRHCGFDFEHRCAKRRRRFACATIAVILTIAAMHIGQQFM